MPHWLAATVPSELEALVSELSGLLQEVGVVPEDRTYRPHITVSRNARNFVTTERLTQRVATEWSGFELDRVRFRDRAARATAPLKQ